MARYRASWVVPIDGPPIPDGVVTVRDGTIRSVEPATDRAAAGSVDDPDVELTGHALLPALVNAHTHLELSGLRGLVPPTASMPDWARQAMEGMAVTPPDPSVISDAIRESRSAGTGLVGDISNTLASVEPLIDGVAPAVVFRELLGFDQRQPDDVVRHEVEALVRRLARQSSAVVRLGLAAHAPYSVVARALFRVDSRQWPGNRTLDRSVGPSCRVPSRSSSSCARVDRSLASRCLKDRGRWRDPTWTPAVPGRSGGFS